MDSELIKLLVENGGLLVVVFLGYKILTNHMHEIVDELKGLRGDFGGLKDTIKEGFHELSRNSSRDSS